MPFLSYAQNFEDVLLWRAFKDLSHGFYVDVGAADPDHDSVTRAFYDRGWCGVNVEPVSDLAQRLTAARPRDVTLQVAVGNSRTEATLFEVRHTGLSTLDREVAAHLEQQGYAISRVSVPVCTLAEILTEYVSSEIHFLKVDVEGAEKTVLQSGDFTRFRPWVVLVEATAPLSTTPTHAEWEPLLLANGYHYVFFDGLNRYYVANERHVALASCFTSPVNVFDDFTRADDKILARQVSEAVAEIEQLRRRVEDADASNRTAYARAFEQARDLADARLLLAERIGQVRVLEHSLQDSVSRSGSLEARLAASEARAEAAESLVAAFRASTSWRVSHPVRMLGSVLRHRQGQRGSLLHARALPNDFSTTVDPTSSTTPPQFEGEGGGLPIGDAGQGSTDDARDRSHLPRLRRAVHQFHSGSAVGDAITNAMLFTQKVLRGLGYDSEIFVEHRDARLASWLRLIEELPRHDDYVLIVRHSMGHDAFARLSALLAPKVLFYHNITPPELLQHNPLLARYAEIGRQQLSDWKPHVVAALADSEYNAIELRCRGYEAVKTCSLLFDVEALRRRGSEPRPAKSPDVFTVLFVGRIIDSKAQLDLVEAYARFRTRLGRPARLVLVGQSNSEGDVLRRIDTCMREHGLEAELVITGPVSDEELHAQYGLADLYVSLSHHEGFGVPPIEAMAHGVPVLAWPAGALPYTLGPGAALLDSRDPDAVAERMLELALNPKRMAAMAEAGRASLERFAIPRQLPALLEALALAGAAPPADPAAREQLAGNMQFAVVGHVEGSYSLAAVNRDLALALETEHPGRVRLLPVGGWPEGRLCALPEMQRSAVAKLAARPAPTSGPQVVISQHYPVHVPAEPGDLPLALLFWEESLLPDETVVTLTRSFRAVLAPTNFVAKIMVDSGLPLPVRVIGQSPDLSQMEAVARDRERLSTISRPFTFLHVSSCFPRKGVDVLLRAYARAFRRNDPVRLVIKTFPNPHNTVEEDVARLRGIDADAPEIVVIDRDLDQAGLTALYREADAMVLPTRGEGFNLPAAEAMAAGLPLIVTGAGGHMDFCDAETARLLAFRYAPSASHLAQPHSLWFEPDEDDLVAALRELFSAAGERAGRAAVAARTRRARIQVAWRLRRRALVRRVRDAALDVLLSPPSAPVRVAWVTSWDVRCGVAEYSRILFDHLPTGREALEHVIIPDMRTAPDAMGPRSRPAWCIGGESAAASLAAAVSVEDPHVVVVQHQPGLIAWAELAACLMHPVLRGRVVVVTLHNTQHLEEQLTPAREVACEALAGVVRVLVHTTADLERLRRLGLSANVSHLPHGVRDPLPARVAREFGSAPLIGCYGFFLPGKGIGTLIQAVAVVRRRWPGARLRLVNAEYAAPLSAAEIERCRGIAEAAGVADAVEWQTDFLPDLESLDLLAACDLIALPYEASKEASSAALRNALRAGPPVIVTPLPLFDEAAHAVLRFPGTGLQDIAVGISDALSDPARLARIQRDAAAWMAAHRWKDVARRFQGMLIGLATQANVDRYSKERPN